MAKLVLNIEPASPSMITSLDRHCVDRTSDGSSDIDPSRSHLNQILAGNPAGLNASIKDLYASGVKRPAKQSESPYLRLVVGASPEYFRPSDPDASGTWDEDRLQAWRQSVMDHLKVEHGDDLVFAELHLDEVTPHIHAVIAPTYLKRPRVPGRQKRGETQQEFEARRALAQNSPGIRTVGRASHPTLSQKNSFLNLRKRMAVALDPLGIEYGDDRSIDAPEAQSTRDWVKSEAARIRLLEQKLSDERAQLKAREAHTLKLMNKAREQELHNQQVAHKLEVKERRLISILNRVKKAVSLAFEALKLPMPSRLVDAIEDLETEVDRLSEPVEDLGEDPSPDF